MIAPAALLHPLIEQEGRTGCTKSPRLNTGGPNGPEYRRDCSVPAANTVLGFFNANSRGEFERP